MTSSDPKLIAVILNLLDGASVRFEPHVLLRVVLLEPDGEIKGVDIRADELTRHWITGLFDFVYLPTPGTWMRRNKEAWGGSDYTCIEWKGRLLTRADRIAAIVDVFEEEESA